MAICLHIFILYMGVKITLLTYCWISISLHRLARIKAEAKRRREEREKLENLKKKELNRRMTLLMKHFIEWNATPEGRVELSLVR